MFVVILFEKAQLFVSTSTVKLLLNVLIIDLTVNITLF